MRILFIILVVVALSYALEDAGVFPDERETRPRGRKERRRNAQRRQPPERQAVKAWAESLTEEDYDYEHWKVAFRSNSPSDFFHAYARKLSDVFKRGKAKLNFALVGACDGNGDKTIKKLYIPNDHWRGVFVEPMSVNVRDLIKFLAEKNIAHRSLVLRGAATLECKEPTIKVERPLYEEKNASLPVSMPTTTPAYFLLQSTSDNKNGVHYSTGCVARLALSCHSTGITRVRSGSLKKCAA